MKTSRSIFTLLILVFCASSILAQTNSEQGKIKQNSYFQKIPYTKIKETLIVVPVTINGKVYKFIIDTGSSLLISRKLYKELHLQTIGQKGINDISGTHKNMDLIIIPELDLQGITFVNTLGIAEDENSFFLKCFGVDGLIGSNMLRNSVIQFDDQNKHIIITDDIKNLSIKNTSKQKMELTREQSRPFINIGHKKGKNKANEKVLFDTGSDSFYKMETGVYKRANGHIDFFDKIAEGEGSFAIGLHGPSETQKHQLLNIPELVIAKTVFSNVVTTTHASHSSIGSKLLRYGITTLDFKKKHFYFKPFDSINTDELSEKPKQIGLTISNNKMVVGIIWNKALESQINLGDEILSINGIDYQQKDACEFLISDNLSIKMTMVVVELRDINTGIIKKIEIKRL